MMKIFLNAVRLMLIITAFTAMHEAMELSKDTERDTNKVDPNAHTAYYNYNSVPAGSLGASAGFAIMSGMCFMALAMTFIRKD